MAAAPPDKLPFQRRVGAPGIVTTSSVTVVLCGAEARAKPGAPPLLALAACSTVALTSMPFSSATMKEATAT